MKYVSTARGALLTVVDQRNVIHWPRANADAAAAG